MLEQLPDGNPSAGELRPVLREVPRTAPGVGGVRHLVVGHLRQAFSRAGRRVRRLDDEGA